uniref:NADH dehydrogenase subunit 6 n=1 Tax=Acrobeloides nanus TaxID=290746 RepID=A0A914CZT6_9BILA
MIAGQLSDRITCISMKLSLKLFVTIASLFLVLGNLSLVFLTVEYSFLAQIALIIVVSFSGLSFVGSMKTSQMISQHYFHIIMVVITLCSSCVSLILPIIVAIVAPDNTQAQWKVIFIGISILIFAGTIIFNIAADVEPRKWVKNSSINKNNLPNNEISIISLPEEEKKSKNDV